MGTFAFYANTIFTPLDKIRDGLVLVEDGVIVKAGARRHLRAPRGATVVDLGDHILAPGLVDIHTHGAARHDSMEASEAALAAIGRFYASHGVTSYLSTTMTADIPATLAAARGLGGWIRHAQSSRDWPERFGARPLGIHFEGPFISTLRCGAQPKKFVHKPSVGTFARMLEAAGKTGRVITLAPEVEGGLDLLRYARRRGVRVTIGHSDATAGEAERAIAAGASHATHVYNAMRPFSHRDPGIIGAVLTDDRISAELICDGVHVLPEAVRLLVRAKSLERVLLVTDSISAAGMPDGRYRLGTITVQVRGGICRTRGKNLAGSTLTLDSALRNLARFIGRSEAECLRCATLNPARIIGVEKNKGTIAPGADADFAVFDKHWKVKQTFIGGIAVLPERSRAGEGPKRAGRG